MRGLRLGFGIARGGAGASFSIAFTGLSTDGIGTYGQVGSHAAISYAITPDNGTETVKWSASPDPGAAATFGTGASPTTFAAADGFLVYLHVTDDGETATRSFSARYDEGDFGALTDQTFTEGDGGTYVHPAATGTGLTWTYAATDLVSGVTYNAGTRTITYSSGLAVQEDTRGATISATDQYGRPASGSPRAANFTITAIDDVAPEADSIEAGTQLDGNIPVSVFGLTEDATAYWVLIPTGGAAPSQAQVLAGQNGSGGAPSDEGSFPATTSLTGYPVTLTASLDGTFDLYMVFQDDGPPTPNNSPVYSELGIVIDSGAAINSVTYDAGGIIIDYTGTLDVTYDAGGIILEAT
jgi:hypothetical protein